MDNNLENMVEVGAEVVDEAVMGLTPLRVAKYVAGGFVIGLGTTLLIKYIVIPGVRKIKEKCGKKKDILDLEEFEG